jgi:hypothetical protein
VAPNEAEMDAGESIKEFDDKVVKLNSEMVVKFDRAVREGEAVYGGRLGP